MAVIDASNRFRRAEKLHIAEKMAIYDCYCNAHAQAITSEEKLEAVNDVYAPINFDTLQYRIIDEEE